MLKTSTALLSLGLILSLTSVACSKQLGKPAVEQSIEFKTEAETGQNKTSTEDQIKIANMGLAQLELLSIKLVKNNIHLEMAGDEPIEALGADLSEEKQIEIEKDLRTYIQITESLERLIQENPEVGDQGRQYNLQRMKRAKDTLALVVLAKKSKVPTVQDPLEQKPADQEAKKASEERDNLLVRSGSYEESVLEITKLEEEVQAVLSNYKSQGIDLTEVSDEGFEAVKALSDQDIQNLDLKIREILGSIEEIKSLRVAANLSELSEKLKEEERNRDESLAAYQRLIAREALVLVD